MPSTNRDRSIPFGRGGEPVDDVQRIAVVRGGGLGDLLFSFPAIDAVAARYPQAEITLMGTPMHAELLEGRPGPVHDVEVLPIAEGLRAAPAGDAEGEDLDSFVARMRLRRFDLALQLHGGGRNSNPFVQSLGARVTAGSRTADAAPLDRWSPYELYQHEFLRGLEVAGLVGAPPVGLEPRLIVTDRDAAAAEALLPPGTAPLLAVHPGATDPRRRWPGAAFGEVVARAADAGWRVVLVGDSGDAGLARRILDWPAASAASVTDLTGRCSLSALVGVLASADVMLGNDSGPRHLAQSVGTATVGVYWVGNVITAAPLSRSRHRVHFGWVTRCPVCDADVTRVGWTAERCAHDPSFVAEVGVDEVWDDLRSLTADRC